MNISKILSLAASAALLGLSTAQATPSLFALGSLGSSTDLSPVTNLLENGVSRNNSLGGIGSGFAWAGGNTFLAVPDRGPNATSWNVNLDDTTSYISRFETMTLSLTNAPSGNFQFTLTPTLTGTTLLSSPTALNYAAANAQNNNIAGAPAVNTAGTSYFTGRSDNFSGTGSTNPNNARFDPEGVRVSNDGQSVFISDEYGPYVYQFDRATGQRIKSFTLPGNLAVTTLGSTTASEGKTVNTTGRVANKGMEGLAITPDGTMLIGIMQAPLLQDSSNNVRIVTIDIAPGSTGATHEYAYKLTTGTGVSEIIALNNHEFLVDERDGKGLGSGDAAINKRLYKIDLANVIGSHEVDAKSGDLSADAFGGSNPALGKTQFLDIVGAMTAAGISAANIPSKIEGLAFGDDVNLSGTNYHTLFITNDNDFVPDTAGTNNIYAFKFTDADLGGSTFQPQNIAVVPEPATWASLGLGALMLGGRLISRRRQLR